MDIISQIKSFVIDSLKINNFDFDENKINVEKTKNIKFGDFSSNVALMLSNDKNNSKLIAKNIVDKIDKSIFEKVEVINPGFINFYLKQDVLVDVIRRILKEKDKFGTFAKKNIKYNIEFVSANPTGLLHLGHARNAAFGDTLARIWTAYGIDVTREYYINDGGNQIEKLGMSVLVRYKQLFDKNINLPEDSYHGNEVIDVAKSLQEKYGNKFVNTKYDDSKIIDVKDGEIIKDFSKKYMLCLIKETLNKINVNFDIWFPESKIYKEDLISSALKKISSSTYEKDGALWLKTTKLGDDKDRVLIKSDKTNTYFVPDIAYHNIKITQGYDKLFNIWGADHASYAERMKIAMQLLGNDADKLVILILQMIKLTKNGQEFKMSKRSGQSFTLQDLIDTIGVNAARWYLVSQSPNSHIEIDIAKASSNTSDNPVYYVQYAHARINQLLNKANYKQNDNYDLLKLSIEKDIINMLNYFSYTIANIAKNYEPNKLTLYLFNLSKLFHSYYSSNKIIDEQNENLSCQRFYLCKAIKQVISNGLKLLAIKPIDKM